MGNKQFTHEVHGISDIHKELSKMNSESKRNFKIAILTAIIAFATLGVSIVALLK